MMQLIINLTLDTLLLDLKKTAKNTKTIKLVLCFFSSSNITAAFTAFSFILCENQLCCDSLVFS